MFDLLASAPAFLQTWWGMLLFVVADIALLLAILALNYRFFAKRLLDILFSAAMLVLFSPFFAGFAIAQALRARRQDGAVFEQKTYAGKNAKPVSLSLFALSDADDVLDRILAVSGMRYYPALAAVFLGRFSFIGPKPFTLPDSAATGEDAFVRFSVRPGLFSSLERFGGKSLTYPDLFEEDAEYAAHFTLFGDVACFFAGLCAHFCGEEGQKYGVCAQTGYVDWLLAEGEITEEEAKAYAERAHARLKGYEERERDRKNFADFNAFK